MGNVVVAGGGIAGLAAGYALAASGHRVRILERGPRPVVSASPVLRRTAPHAAHSHTLTSLGVRTLREYAPEVLSRAEEGGATMLDLTTARPAGPAQADDDELVTLACRRPMFEAILYDVLTARSGVTVEHGVTIRGIRLDATSTAVTGVHTDRGPVPADVVVDATGWRSASRRWLRDAGVPVPADRVQPSRMRGYSRHYRLCRPGRPGKLNRGNAAGDIWSHYAGVLHPGEGDTFSIAIGVPAPEQALDGLRHPAAFTAVARATPGLAPWLADGVAEPISPVFTITCPPNMLRAAAVEPPVDGLVPVGDAACVTNPLFGRGMSAALAHGFALRDALPAPDEPARRLHVAWYEFVAASERDRLTRWADPGSGVQSELTEAARADSVVWRAVIRVLMGLADPSVLGRDDLAERIRRAPRRPRPEPAPDRAQLVHAAGRRS